MIFGGRLFRFLSLFCFLGVSAPCQTLIFQENFDGGVPAGWTFPNETLNDCSGRWFASGKEGGRPAGSTCTDYQNANFTLHVGQRSGPCVVNGCDDCGAYILESDCGGAPPYNTEADALTSVIPLAVGTPALRVSFDYIAGRRGACMAGDYAQVFYRYSTDGGGSWTGFWITLQVGGDLCLPATPGCIINGVEEGAMAAVCLNLNDVPPDANAVQFMFRWVSKHDCDGVKKLTFAVDELAVYTLPAKAQEANVPLATVEICKTSATLAATPSGGHWTLQSGTGNIADPDSNFTAVSGLSQPGPNVFRYTLDDGCETTFDEVSITVIPNTLPPVNAGLDQTVCALGTQLAASLPGAGATGTWTVVSGPGGAVFEDPHARNSVISDLTVNNTYVLRWTVTDGTCTDYDEMQIIVLQSPNTSNAGLDKTVCGDSYQLNAVTPSAGQGTWSQTEGPNAAVFSDIHNPKATITSLTPGVYTFIWTVTAGADCPVFFDDVVITVLPGQPVSITGPTTLCQGETAVYTALGATFAAYQWAITGGAPQGAADASAVTVLFALDGPATVKLTVTDDNNCQTVETLAVTVLPKPYAEIAPAGTLLLCTDSSLTLLGLTSSGATLQWQKDGVNIPNQTGQNLIVSQTGDYTLIASLGQCKDTSNVVTVNVVPQTTMILSPPVSVSFCEGDSVTLLASFGAGFVYQWFKDGVLIVEGPDWFFKAKESGVYQSIIPGSGGVCPVVSNKVTITVNPNPTVTILADANLTICTNDVLQIQAQATAGASVQWYLNGVGITGATSLNYFPTAAGEYYIIATLGECKDTSNIINITTKLPPSALINVNGPLTICSGQGVLLSADSPQSGWTYQWTLEGNDIAGATGTTYLAAQAGSYSLIINDGICSAEAPPVQVNVGTTPNAQISPQGPLVLCPDSTLTLSTPFNALYTYQWQRDGQNLTGGATGTTYPALIPGSYTVIVKQGECADTSAIIVVTEGVPLVVTVEPGAPTICANGLGVTLEAYGADSYTWAPPDGLSATSGASVLANPSSTTTYTVTGAKAGSCASTAVVTVTVGNPVNPIITPSGVIGICTGGNVTLTVSPSSGVYQYQWYKDGTALPGQIGNAISVNAAGVYFVYVDDAACGVFSPSVTVEVVDTFQATLVAEGSTVICGNQTVKLVASNGGLFKWLKDGALIPGSTNILIVSQPGTYSVVVTDAACTDTANVVVVTQQPLPAPTISADGALEFCAGDSVLLSTPFNAGWTYQWQKNNSDISGATNNTYWAKSAGVYKVIVFDGNCNGVSQNTLTVIIKPAPSVVLTPLDTFTVCAGGSVTLTANVTDPNLTFSWYEAGFLLVDGNGNPFDTPTLTVTEEDYYYVIVSDGECSTKSNEVTLIILPGPSASINPQGPFSICEGQTALLSANTGPNLTYQWKRNGTNIQGAVQSTYNAPQPGTYMVTVTDTSVNCSNTSQTVVVNVGTTIDVTIDPQDPQLCIGATTGVTLTASGALDYFWSPAGGLDTTAGAIVVANPAVDTEYSVIGVDALGCTGTDTVTVVYLLPDTIHIAPQSPLSLCPGETVTLTALNVSGLSLQWNKDGVAIPNAINATYDATQAGSYTITTQGGATCPTLSDTVIVNVQTPPQASIIPPGPLTFCTGATLTLTALPNADVSYQWVKDGVLIANGANSTLTISEAGNYSVIIQSNLTSCKDTSLITEVSVTNGLTVSVLPDNAQLCPGSAEGIALTASGAVNYNWSPPDGLDLTTGANVVAQPTQTTTYTVTGDDGAGCTGTATVTITVWVPPFIVVTDGPLSFCPGDSVKLTVKPLFPGDFFEVQWIKDGVNIPNATDPDYIAKASGEYVPFVTDAACSYPLDTITVNVLTPPAVNVFPANITICITDSVHLIALTASNVTYQWLFDGVAITDSTSSTMWAHQAGTYTVAVIDAVTGCKDTSNAAVITIGNSLDISVAPAAPTVCLGGVGIELTASGAQNFAWSPPDGLDTATGAVVTANPIETTTYTVKGTNADGCTGETTVTVTIVVPPPVDVTASGPTTFCAGESVTLTAESGFQSYQWRKNEVDLAGYTNPEMVATESGEYTVLVFDGQCVGVSLAIEVAVNPLPNVSIDPPGPLLICAGGSFTFLAQTNEGISFQWFLDGNPISGATNQSYTGNTTGEYTVETTDANGCKKLSTAAFVNLGTKITLTIAPPSATLCFGSPTGVELTVSGASGYVWSPPDGLNATTGATVTANPDQTTTYTVSGFDPQSNCPGDTTVTVTKVYAPAPPITPDSAVIICAGTGAALSTVAGGSFTYQWYKDGAAISGATASAYVATETGDYTVEVNDGACITRTDTINVWKKPIPIAEISPAPTVSFCLGSSALLSTPVNQGYSFQWFLDGIPISGATNDTYLATESGAYTVRVTSDGCDSLSAPVNVTSIPPPGATITGLLSVCPAGSTVLEANLGQNFIYQWFFNGNPIPGATDSVFTASALGAYAVSVTQGLCADTSLTATLTQAEAPEAVITPPGPFRLCVGTIALSANASANFSYQWQKDGVDVVGAVNVDFSAVAPGDYTVIITEANGCRDTSAVVVVEQGAPLDILVSPNPATYCLGQTGATLAASGGENYNWAPSSGLNTASGATVVASPILSTTYTVTGSDSAGCVGSAEITVEVLDPPAVADAGRDTVLCEGVNTYDLQGLAITDGQSAGNWSVLSGAGVFADDTDPQTTVSGLAIGVNTFRWTITLGGSSCPPNVDEVKIIMVEPLFSDFLRSKDTVCLGDTLFITHPFADSANAYLWNLDDAEILSVNADSSRWAVRFNTLGPKTLTMNYSRYGCASDGPTTHEVFVVPDPVAAFAPFCPALPCTLQYGEPIAFKSLSQNDVYRQWDFGDGTTSTEPNPVYTYWKEGQVDIRLTVWAADSACFDVAEVKGVQIRDVVVIDFPNVFTPNADGVNDDLHVQIHTLFKTFKLSVYDRWGMQVWETDSPNNRWNGTNANAERVPPGQYFYTLELERLTGKKIQKSGGITLLR